MIRKSGVTLSMAEINWEINFCRIDLGPQN